MGQMSLLQCYLECESLVDFSCSSFLLDIVCKLLSAFDVKQVLACSQRHYSVVDYIISQLSRYPQKYSFTVLVNQAHLSHVLAVCTQPL